MKPGKQSVELRPSRIRRDPVPAAKPIDPNKQPLWFSSERETWVVVVGVVLFALALAIITLGVSDFTSQ